MHSACFPLQQSKHLLLYACLVGVHGAFGMEVVMAALEQ